jgi:hypothetical protein
MAAAKFNVRVLGAAGIEDFHAHLLRRDRASRFAGLDDRGIDAHCLSLISGGAILIGAYVDGLMRAAAQIVPDRTGRRAEAAITTEQGFEDQAIVRAVTSHVIEEARRCQFSDLRVLEQSSTTHIRVSPAVRHAANG